MNKINLNTWSLGILLSILVILCSWELLWFYLKWINFRGFPDTPFEVIIKVLDLMVWTMMELRTFYTHWQKCTKSVVRISTEYSSKLLSCTILSLHVELYLSWDAWARKNTYFKAVQTGRILCDNHLPHEGYMVKLPHTLTLITIFSRSCIVNHELRKQCIKEFEKAERYGATGFPTVIAKINGKHFLVTQDIRESRPTHRFIESTGFTITSPF